jgi:hypothetical protein
MLVCHLSEIPPLRLSIFIGMLRNGEHEYNEWVA